MDFLLAVFQLVLFFLLSCDVRDCYKVACTGELTVDQDSVPIGSNLTVHCRSGTVKCGRLFVVKFNGKEVLRKTSCSKVTAQVVVNEPNSWLYCAVEEERTFSIVCGRDILAHPIPSPPHIDNITFAKGSLSPIIHWHSSDNMENLKPTGLYKRQGASGWMRGNLSQLHKGTVVLSEKLEPLTLYQFELRVCTASMENNCSLWSKPFIQNSPGKAPSIKLDVWRIIMRNEYSDTQNVTVMWKPLNKEDYNGVLHHYEIVYQEKGTTHILKCSTAVGQYTLQVPLEVTEMNVSAVTSAGSSPPALLRLACSGIPSPEVNLSHAAGGGINLIWDSLHLSNRTWEQMLGFVVQWQCNPFQIQWKRMKNNSNSVYIHATQLALCNISLYAESSNGLSCSSFKQIHTFKDLEVMNKNPDLEFIQRSHSPANKTRNGLAVWICLITVFSVVIILNLLRLKCARQRMRTACFSMGPSWLFQDLPKLGNSNAIKLLKDERCGSDLYCQPVNSDPPLSIVEYYSLSVERKDLYPIVHKDITTEERTVVQDWTVCPYKPQITISQGAEAACEVAEKEEDEPWVVFSSSVFNTFEQHFLPSQGMHAPLPSCLTVDGRPVSMNLVDGFPLFSLAALDENMETGGFVETGNGDQIQQQSQTVLPNSLESCLREPLFNNTVLRNLHPLQIEEQLC